MKKVIWILSLLTISASLLTGCKCKCLSDFKKSDQNMLTSALESSHFTSPAQLKEMSQEDFILVDLRPRSVFAQGALEGAVNIPSSELLVHDNFEVLKHSEKPIILYGNDAAAANGAWFMLTQLDVKNVTVLSSGYDHFTEENPRVMETAQFDYAAVFTEAVEAHKKLSEAPKPVVIAKPVTPKKIVPVKKKEVEEEEGC